MTQEKIEKNAKRDDKKPEDKKKEKDHPPTKIVIRRLPPTLTPEDFLDQVSPLPGYDFFYFVRADMSLGAYAFTRAYINFQNPEEVFAFRDKFDGYVFVDAKGNDYPAVVEFATFQKVPKKKPKKADSKKGSVEQDTDYKRFVESLQNPESDAPVSLDSYLEELEEKERLQKASNGLRVQTPLLDYLKKRKEERKTTFLKQREERKRRELDRRRIKEEDRRRRKDRDQVRDSLRENPRDRDRYWDSERPREKEREGAKDKDRSKQDRQEGKDKERSKQDRQESKDKERWKQDRQETVGKQQPVKLLKNLEREKEKEIEKEQAGEKSREDKDVKNGGRENLRFSKENRERERAERERVVRGEKTPPPDKERISVKLGSGKSNERGKSLRDDRLMEKPRSARDYNDRYQRDDRALSNRNERDKQSNRDKNRDRPSDRNRSRELDYDKERNRLREKEREVDLDRDRPRDRDGDPDRKKDKSSSTLQVGRDGSGDVGRNNNSKRTTERDRLRDESSFEERGKSLTKLGTKDSETRSACKSTTGLEQLDTRMKSKLQTDTQRDEPEKQSQNEDGQMDADDRKRKRKERPERQIYIPRARRQQQQDTSKTQALDIKRELDTSKTQPLAVKCDLETAQAEALDVKQELDTSNTQALDSKEELDTPKTQAPDGKQDLETPTAQALDGKQDQESSHDRDLNHNEEKQEIIIDRERNEMADNNARDEDTGGLDSLERELGNID